MREHSRTNANPRFHEFLQAGSVNELCNALLSAELKLETKWPCAWRAVASFAEHIATFPDFFTTEPIRHKIFPLTFKFLTVNVSPFLNLDISLNAFSTFFFLKKDRSNFSKYLITFVDDLSKL